MQTPKAIDLGGGGGGYSYTQNKIACFLKVGFYWQFS